MNCERAELLLQLAEDGELTDAEGEALESHLEGCVECRRMEAWLEVLDENFESAADVFAESGGMEDAVVGAMKESALPSIDGVEREPTQRTGKRDQKKSMVARLAQAAFNRVFKRRKESEPAQPQPTQLERYRALRETIASGQETIENVRAVGSVVGAAVSVPVKGYRLIKPVLTRKDGS